MSNTKQLAETNMKKAIEAYHNELAKMRTGRAHSGLLEQIMVPYFGNDTPLKQVASITVSDSRTLLVTPWEKTMVQPIEKAIQISGLGLNPATSGNAIRVPLPALTEDRRKDMIKIVKQEAENAKVSIRNARRDANNSFKESLKKKLITEDEEKRSEDEIQKMTDKYIKEVDQILATKEKELLEV